MFLVIGICITIGGIFWYIAYILKKSGKFENETKQWQQHAKILEKMRKIDAEVDNMSDDDIADIVRKNSNP